MTLKKEDIYEFTEKYSKVCLDTQIVVFNGPSPGFTRNLKAKPFANPETTNQSQHIAKI